jgi:predicted small lipoprotein YifL
MNKIKRILMFVIPLSLVVFLTACGSKGDLYHEKPASSQPGETQDEQQVKSQPQKKGQ